MQDVSLVVSRTDAAVLDHYLSCYLCPALIYTKAVRLVKGEDSLSAFVAYKRERLHLAWVPFSYPDSAAWESS
jgi:hypothetical protein